MKKLKQHPKAILAGLLFIIGACTVIFGKSMPVQCGVTCIFWGIAVFVLAWVANDYNAEMCDSFDDEAYEILSDIAQKGTESEYYMFYNMEKIEKLKSKMLKKQRKQLFSFATIGVMLIIVAITCFV